MHVSVALETCRILLFFDSRVHYYDIIRYFLVIIAQFFFLRKFILYSVCKERKWGLPVFAVTLNFTETKIGEKISYQY